MWVKNSDGELVNLASGVKIKVQESDVVLELTVRRHDDICLKRVAGVGGEYFQFEDDFAEEMNYEYKVLESFNDEAQAAEYLKKLGMKLQAEEI